MEIRFATAGDIPGMIDLLLQVGEVHHKIRPDLFRAGAQKYDEAMMSTDGEEHERAECVYIQLLNGLGECSDEDE